MLRSWTYGSELLQMPVGKGDEDSFLDFLVGDDEGNDEGVGVASEARGHNTAVGLARMVLHCVSYGKGKKRLKRTINLVS